MFTGLLGEEYLVKEIRFFNDPQLEITLKDASEELKEDILMMQTCKEMIEIISFFY